MDPLRPGQEVRPGGAPRAPADENKPKPATEKQLLELDGDEVDGVKVPPHPAPAAAPQPTPAAIKVQQPEPKQEEAPGDKVAGAVDDVKVPTHPAPAATTQPTPAAIKVQQPEPKQEAPGDKVAVAVDDVKVPTHPAPAVTAKLVPVVKKQPAMEDLDGHDVRVEGGPPRRASMAPSLQPLHLQGKLVAGMIDAAVADASVAELQSLPSAAAPTSHRQVPVQEEKPAKQPSPSRTPAVAAPTPQHHQVPVAKEKPENQPSRSPALAATAAAYQPIPVVEDEGRQEQLSPPAAACQQLTMNWLLGALTVTILGVILVADLSIHPATWADKITAKTSKDWLVAGFVAVGSVTSLLLSYSRLTIYLAVWREGTAGSFARVVPSVASLLNCLVWVCYGFLLHPANAAMIVVNLTGAAFHIGYVSAYIFYSDTKNRIWVVIMLLVAAGAGGAIAAIDLHGNHGMELPDAVGWSAVATACLMYGMPLLVLVCQLLASGTTAAVPNVLVLGATSLNALVWLIDGFVVHNDRLQVPHGVGVVLCFTQAAIYLCCSKINSKKAPRSTSTSPLHESLLENV